MVAPHFVKKRRTVAFSVENQNKAAKVRVLIQLRIGGLIGNLFKQPGNNIAPQGLEQSWIDLFFNYKKRPANRIINPVVGDTPLTQALP
jgi:hypothetical protein